MKMRLLLVGLLLSRDLLAAACCLGGSIKGFISLQRQELYQLGLSSTFRDVFGRFNGYGELENAETIQTTSLALGGGIRLTRDLQAFVILPWVNSAHYYGARGSASTAVGDILLGAQYVVTEPLFRDEWLPTVTLSGGVKAPTGTVERMDAGRRVPGTGNGLWEPFVGLAVDKALGWPTLSLRATYTRREDGDLIEFAEYATGLVTNRFSIAAGALQTFRRDPSRRVAGVFLSPTYFLTQAWSVMATADVTIPLDGFGMGEQAARGVALTTRYAFF